MKSALLFILLVLIFTSKGQGIDDCTISGLCQGITISTKAGGDKADCVDFCRDDPACVYFTYDYADTFCGAYSGCDTFDESCVTCVSGESDCPLQSCNQAGGCVGKLEDEFSVGSNNEQTCGDYCNSSPLCNWYTYYPTTGNCLLYSSCDPDPGACSGCFTSEKECSEQDLNPPHVMLVFTDYTYDTITVMDLNNPQRNCSNIDMGPLDLISSPQSIHASYVGGYLMACGELSQECYQYDDVLEDWTDMADRLSNRYMPYALDLDENRNWISGGSETNTSEVYDGEFFHWSVDLPVNSYIYGHCAVYLGDNKVMVMGGIYNGNRAFVINVITGQVTDLPSIPFPSQFDLYLPACGLATKSDGSKIVVLAGGALDGPEANDVTFIYDPDQGLFLPGPPLPQPRVFGRAVQYQNSFLIVGGGDSTLNTAVMQKEIYWFDPDSESWITLDVELDNPDFVTAALMVPDYFNVECNFDF